MLEPSSHTVPSGQSIPSYVMLKSGQYRPAGQGVQSSTLAAIIKSLEFKGNIVMHQYTHKNLHFQLNEEN